MPGKLVSDALAAELDAATAISTNTTTTGSAVRVGFPGHVQVELKTGTITDGTYDVSIQSSWDSAFTAGNVVEVGRFDQLDLDDDSETKALETYVDAPYLRSVIVSAGTTSGGTIGPIKVRESHFQRVTAGPGMPTAPGTGTGFPDSSNDAL
jgi:hypothetical protein